MAIYAKVHGRYWENIAVSYVSRKGVEIIEATACTIMYI
jgi:hypothetical protein